MVRCLGSGIHCVHATKQVQSERQAAVSLSLACAAVLGGRCPGTLCCLSGLVSLVRTELAKRVLVSWSQGVLESGLVHSPLRRWPPPCCS